MARYLKFRRIKLPKTELVAEIVLNAGPAYFPGDNTCIVSLETLERLAEAGEEYTFAKPRRKPKGRRPTRG